MNAWANQKGFTIVELLIVIVVIAILATISIVAYNGIQDRAKYTHALSDLTTIKKALLAYQAENGTFPVTGTLSSVGWRYYCVYPTNFIPGLETVISQIPPAPCNGASTSYDSWLYGSDGTGYKLLYIRANVSDAFKNMIPAEMHDTRWSSGVSWGYWTDDWKNA